MKLGQSTRKVLFVLFCFFTPLEVWAGLPTKAVEVRLSPEVVVSGENVVLGDVATIYAKNMRDFRALSDLNLSKVGETGELKLPQGYLEARIREALPAGTDFRLHAPGVVTFRLNRLGLSTAEFAEEVARRGRAEGKIPEWAEVEVEPVNGFDQLKLWRLSEARIDPAAEMARWKGELAFKISRGSELTWVKVRVRWFAKAWTAKRNIGLLSSLSPADFTATRVELTNSREDPLLAEEDLAAAVGSARARRSLAAGTPLSLAALERAPDARPGQALRVVFISESGVRVSAEGALVGAGSIGSEARAKLRSSRKVVTGKLVAGNLMEVSLCKCSFPWALRSGPYSLLPAAPAFSILSGPRVPRSTRKPTATAATMPSALTARRTCVA
jgi:flagella basal body P-ring formation protein FlgA